MKKSRFSEQQIAFVLRQAEEGTPIAEVCRKAGISEASFYNWRKKYGGLLQGDAVGRDAPENMKGIKEIAETRVRYGYRRIHGLLRREGWLVNPKRVCRLYREMGLQRRSKSPKRRVKAQLREDRAPATAPNQVWATDFVHDPLFDGRKLRILTVVDTFTRLSPAIDVRQQFRGADVVAVLERVGREIGCPKTIRLDNGPEFLSKELDLWAFMRGVTLDFSRPGKPTDNAFIESLNGKFRAECLNANWFLSLDEARRKCEAWRKDYNEVRPHSAIGNQVPAMLHRTAGNPGQAAVR